MFEKLSNGSWYDPGEQIEFGPHITWYDRPSEFSFFCSPQEYQRDSRWGAPHTLRYLVRPTMMAYRSSDEYIISSNLFDKIKGKRVMVVGGGPTALERDWKSREYDILLTCNRFYQSSLFEDGTKVDIAVIGPEQDLRSEEVLTWFKQNDTICVIESGTSPFKSREEIQDFCLRFPGKIGYMGTRFFDKTGVGPRLVALAGFCGAKEVLFAGIDGYPQLSKIHSFEENKQHIGCSADLGAERRYLRELFTWSEYLREQFPNLTIRNLGFGDHRNQVPFEVLGAS